MLLTKGSSTSTAEFVGISLVFDTTTIVSPSKHPNADTDADTPGEFLCLLSPTCALRPNEASEAIRDLHSSIDFTDSFTATDNEQDNSTPSNTVSVSMQLQQDDRMLLINQNQTIIRRASRGTGLQLHSLIIQDPFLVQKYASIFLQSNTNPITNQSKSKNNALKGVALWMGITGSAQNSVSLLQPPLLHDCKDILSLSPSLTASSSSSSSSSLASFDNTAKSFATHVLSTMLLVDDEQRKTDTTTNRATASTRTVPVELSVSNKRVSKSLQKKPNIHNKMHNKPFMSSADVARIASERLAILSFAENHMSLRRFGGIRNSSNQPEAINRSRFRRKKTPSHSFLDHFDYNPTKHAHGQLQRTAPISTPRGIGGKHKEPPSRSMSRGKEQQPFETETTNRRQHRHLKAPGNDTPGRVNITSNTSDRNVPTLMASTNDTNRFRTLTLKSAAIQSNEVPGVGDATGTETARTEGQYLSYPQAALLRQDPAQGITVTIQPDETPEQKVFNPFSFDQDDADADADDFGQAELTPANSLGNPTLSFPATPSDSAYSITKKDSLVSALSNEAAIEKREEAELSSILGITIQAAKQHQKDQSDAVHPRILVNMALNEDLTCSYKQSKLSSCSIEGVVQVQVKSNAFSASPFSLLLRDPSRHIRAIQENRRYADDMTESMRAAVKENSTSNDGGDPADYKFTVSVPKAGNYFPIMRYKCNAELCPVPIRVQTRVRVQKSLCRVALQISSNPSNEDDLKDLMIIMGVPEQAKGETLTTSPAGGVWNAAKRSVIWCVSELAKGEKFQLQAQFGLAADLSSVNGNGTPKFPVLVRCQCMHSQLSDIELEVSDIPDVFPADVTMKLARRFDYLTENGRIKIREDRRSTCGGPLNPWL